MNTLGMMVLSTAIPALLLAACAVEPDPGEVDSTDSALERGALIECKGGTHGSFLGRGEAEAKSKSKAAARADALARCTAACPSEGRCPEDADVVCEQRDGKYSCETCSRCKVKDRDAGTDASQGDGATDTGRDAASTSDGGMPSTFDAFQQRNLTIINQYRATRGVAPLALDVRLSTFALAGSKQLAQDHLPHQHFIDAVNGGTLVQSGFQGSGAENQGPGNGLPKMADDPVSSEMLQIAAIQKAMFDEGPGLGVAHGHYTNMMSSAYRRVGIGLHVVGTSLYLTNDFSP